MKHHCNIEILNKIRFFDQGIIELRHNCYAYPKKLPRYFYRATSVKTATRSKYEIDDLRTSDAKRKIKRGMAFQALERFTFDNDMTLKRYERQHKQQMKRNPFSYVSVTNNFGEFQHTTPYLHC